MKYQWLPIAAACLVVVASPHAAQEPAGVKILVTIPAKVATFENQRLEVLLLQTDPRIADKGPMLADRHLDKEFSHAAGKETRVEIVLGAKAKINPRMQYSLKVQILDSKTNTPRYIGERDGQPGPVYVLTQGAASKVTMIVRPK